MDVKVDGLLSEYVRVINDKDKEIHDLIVENEKISLGARQREDKHKNKLRSLKKSLEELQVSTSLLADTRVEVTQLKDRISVLNNERKNLDITVVQLKATTTKLDDELRASHSSRLELQADCETQSQLIVTLRTSQKENERIISLLRMEEAQQKQYHESEVNATQHLKLLIESQEQEKKSLQADFDSSRRKIADLEERLASSLKQSNVLIAEVTRIREEHTKHLEELSSTLNKERRERELLETQHSHLKSTSERNERYVTQVNEELYHAKRSANDHTAELREELESTRRRNHGLIKELNDCQRSLGNSRTESTLAKTEHEAAVAALNSDFVEPLRAQAASLSSARGQLEIKVKELSDTVAEQRDTISRQSDQLERQRSDVLARDRRISLLQDDYDHLKRVETEFSNAKKELILEKENRMRLIAFEQQVKLLTKEIHDARARETAQLEQHAQRKSEIATWRERCANLESLKSVSEAAVEDYKRREVEMLDKIEEMHQTQTMMQACFDKQQEQIEISRRLQDNDSISASNERRNR